MVLSLRVEFTLNISLSYQTQNLYRKASSRGSSIAMMAPRKQIVVLNEATSKGKAINIIGGMVPPPTIDQSHITENMGSLPQGAAANIQTPSPHSEDQILQMFFDMKQQMKEQQAQSDRDREQAALDRDNAIHEHEH